MACGHHHRVPSTVYLKAFGVNGIVTDENEPYRGGHANHMQDTDAASCILGSPNFACFPPSDIPRVNAKSRGGDESGLPETGSSGGPRTTGMEQINRRLEIIQYG